MQYEGPFLRFEIPDAFLSCLPLCCSRLLNQEHATILCRVGQQERQVTATFPEIEQGRCSKSYKFRKLRNPVFVLQIVEDPLASLRV